MSGTGLTYRTPADVRAIPNEQWERWLRDESLPFQAFSASAHCQLTMRTVLKATQRRIGAQ